MDCKNLRTLIFAVITFDKLYKKINKLISSPREPRYLEIFNEELKQIMRSVFFVSINYKSGKSIRTNNNGYSSLLY